jgi:hypothetical protein
MSRVPPASRLYLYKGDFVDLQNAVHPPAFGNERQIDCLNEHRKFPPPRGPVWWEKSDMIPGRFWRRFELRRMVKCPNCREISGVCRTGGDLAAWRRVCERALRKLKACPKCEALWEWHPRSVSLKLPPRKRVKK